MRPCITRPDGGLKALVAPDRAGQEGRAETELHEVSSLLQSQGFQSL